MVAFTVLCFKRKYANLHKITKLQLQIPNSKIPKLNNSFCSIKTDTRYRVMFLDEGVKRKSMSI